MRSMLGALVVVAAVAAGPALATADKGQLFYNGGVVRTVVPPSAFPQEGRDPFFAVTNGADGQLGITGVAPGNPAYHGGHWAFHAVTFKAGVTPYLLTSQAAVEAAAARGDVTVVRDASRDFLCPVQK
jgi:hypothetical protein